MRDNSYRRCEADGESKDGGPAVRQVEPCFRLALPNCRAATTSIARVQTFVRGWMSDVNVPGRSSARPRLVLMSSTTKTYTRGQTVAANTFSEHRHRTQPTP